MDVFYWFIGLFILFCFFMAVKTSGNKPQTSVSDSNAYNPVPSKSDLPEYIQTALTENLFPNETTKVIIPGLSDTAMIATDRRVFIFKKGMLGGATFGSKTASWDYKNLSGVQIETGSITGVLSLQGPGIISQDLSSWSFLDDSKTDAWAAPHALVFGQKQMEGAKQGVIKLRQIMSNAQQGNQLGDLEKLAELRDKGIITESEFQSKKQQILKL